MNGEQIALRRARPCAPPAARGVPRRRSPSARRRPARASPRAGRCRGARGSRAARRRRGRRPRAGRARAARRGSRCGSSSPSAGVDPLGRVDVAVRHPAADRLWRHVDQLDLVRAPHDGVRDRLLLLDPGDLLDDVVDRFEVLDVERRDDGDAGFEQLSTSSHRFSWRDPGTLVWASSSTRATSGRRAMIASTSISSNVVPRYSMCARGTTSRPTSCAQSSGGRGSRRSRRRRRCRVRRAGDPRRASRMSSRPRERRRGRCEAFPVPCAED